MRVTLRSSVAVVLTTSALLATAVGVSHAQINLPGATLSASWTRLLLSAPPFGLTDPRRKDIAMQLVSSAENATLNWRAQYGYIEDLSDGRGYTAGIVGFCSGTSDLLAVVTAYAAAKPGNGLSKYVPALRAVNGTASHTGLGDAFVRSWKAAAADPVFRHVQVAQRDRVYFAPALAQAHADGLGALGQFIYFDAIVMHGPGTDAASFGGIRAAASSHVRPPTQGGDQVAYLRAFLDARARVMRSERAHSDTSRIDTAQRRFLDAGNLRLDTPLTWSVYGQRFDIR